jgi:predicted nucleotidyltransferase
VLTITFSVSFNEGDPATPLLLHSSDARDFLLLPGSLRGHTRTNWIHSQALLHRHRRISVSVFGSAARGDDTENSAIDFLVQFEMGSSLFDLLHLQEDPQELLTLSLLVVSRIAMTTFGARLCQFESSGQPTSFGHSRRCKGNRRDRCHRKRRLSGEYGFPAGRRATTTNHTSRTEACTLCPPWTARRVSHLPTRAAESI